MANRPGIVGAALLATAIAFVEFGAPRTALDGALAPEAVKPLQAIAKEVAAAGRRDELTDLFEILRRAGFEGNEFDKFSAACERDLAKVKTPAPSAPSAAKSLQKVAADLAAHLPDRNDADRIELARLIVRLDEKNEAAEQALGREKTGDEWLDAKTRARRARRLEIAGAVARARALDVKFEILPSTHPILLQSNCKEPALVRVGPLEVHSVWPAEKLARVVRQSLRALALANFLLTDELQLPEVPKLREVYFDTPPAFRAATERARQAGKIDAALVPILDRMDAVTVDGELVAYKIFESDFEAELLARLVEAVRWKRDELLSMKYVQPGLAAGFTNWCCLTMFGTRLPIYVVQEEKSRTLQDGGTAGSSREQRELRERLMLLSDAGISGGRAWLQFLAERHEDPPLLDLFVDQIGKVQGDKLLKSTFVVEMLAEEGGDRLFEVCRKLPPATSDPSLLTRLELALGEPSGKFDSEWRDWIAAPKAGLAQRLAAPSNSAPPTDEQRNVLEALRSIRHDAELDAIVDLDRATSEACRRHARYLGANPDQSSRWPDIHEEYPDRPAFDAAGASAGSHSVIAVGVKDGRDALNTWMATLYHRLPLLDPALLRIGYAYENGCAVLDSGSFVGQRKGPLDVPDRPPSSRRGDPTFWAVVWPPPNSSSIPTRYSQELPPPIPGEDPSKLGYPITFQLRARYLGEKRVTLELHAGDAKGPAVACWCSTPTNPTNPSIAPDDAWCLIPKQPLRSGAYTVTGVLHVEITEIVDEPFKWTFRCGK